MKKKLVFSFIWIIVILLSCSTNQHVNGDWELIWEDEFEGSMIDWSMWSKTPRGESDWNDAMSNADELYDLKDGKLILRGIKNIDYSDDPSPYLTGGIWGKGKQNFSVVRVDVRAKFSCAQGFWPAIWLMPVKNDSTPDYYSELDIMEHLNFDDYVYQTLHSTYTLEKQENRSNPFLNHVKVDIDVSKFNTYSVEIHSDRVVFLTNNQITHTYPSVESLGDPQFPFDKFNYYLILSAQLGGNWVGEVDTNQLPVEMLIDWVKFYQKK